MPVAFHAQALNRVIWDRNVTGWGIEYLNARLREATSGDEMMKKAKTPFANGTDPVYRDNDPGRTRDPYLRVNPDGGLNESNNNGDDNNNNNNNNTNDNPWGINTRV